MNGIVWTCEQKDILATDARVTLVRAGPGSGKTKVFVETANRYLDSWAGKRGGIAALSYTNAAREEMTGRLGGTLPAPHFVGTLDSFFLRFVVAPFGHLAGITPSGAWLIPSPIDEEIRKPSIDLRRQGGKPNPIPLFRINPTGGGEADPRFSAKPYYGGPGQVLPPNRAAEGLQMKKAEWASRGRITHADSHYLAAAIIRGSHGDAVRGMIARRFPVILVDEFQDTGHFLGRALLSLLTHTSISAMLVGDEDQRIFGFSGVDPELFMRAEELDGCKGYPMRTTQRCCVRGAAVASALSRSRARVEPKADAKQGAAVLLVHDDPKGCRSPSTLQRAADLCRVRGCRSLAVLVRRRDEKRALLGSDQQGGCPLKARGPRALHKAVICLMDGRGDHASRVVESRLGHLVLENECPHREDLDRSGVDPVRFRRHARSLVLQAARCQEGETWGQWGVRMKQALEQAAKDLGGSNFARRLGNMFKADPGDETGLPRSGLTTTPKAWRNGLDVEILTIHEAKGREFDAVLVYCSNPSASRRISTCPSVGWWSDDEGSEEREVAFVAVTRARDLLVLSVHSKSFRALSAKRPEFVGLFDPVTRAGSLSI